ncbi:MAG TPA: toxin-antitoxin system YwqK family antitoxin [Saprospiraceae bacterium]|nr:toxin-antitoxin system YwqK family antitoxin [Saprospiraceae bacterium]
MKITYGLLSVVMLLLLSFCAQDPLETVEQKNDRGQLERFQRRKDNQKREGLFQRYSAEGVLLEEAHYLADSLDGERKYFSASGQLESIERYQNNKIHGKFQAFYPDGKVKIEQDFVAGALTGFSIRYYPNGQIQEKVQLKNNVEDGPFVEYHENGQLKTEGTYAPNEEGDGLENGELKEYDESGQLIRVADCQNGMCLTKWKKN